jgi:hypothetical protein
MIYEKHLPTKKAVKTAGQTMKFKCKVARKGSFNDHVEFDDNGVNQTMREEQKYFDRLEELGETLRNLVEANRKLREDRTHLRHDIAIVEESSRFLNDAFNVFKPCQRRQ